MTEARAPRTPLRLSLSKPFLRLRLPCLAALMLLTACETIKPPPPPPPPPEPIIREVQVPVEVFIKVPDVTPADSAARNFFAYFERARQMAPAELGREFQRLDPPTSAAAILEMAVALGQTRNPSDTVRALGLLDPLLKSTDPQMGPYQPLARLLAARYNEQRRLEDHIERQSQQLKDSQRKQDQLTQQLEALKAIERSLTARRSAAASAPAASANSGKVGP